MPDSHPTGPIRLRLASRAEAPALVRLIVALAEFEKLTPPDAAARQRLIDDGFGRQPRFQAWLAFFADEPEPVGYALVFETYSSFEARATLYLEDIFVLPQFRDRGIGSALLRNCIRIADESGCARMEWTCLNWNTRAQEKYNRLGARRLDEWLLYRLDRPSIESISRSNI